jgi:hypothetical protein
MGFSMFLYATASKTFKFLFLFFCFFIFIRAPRVFFLRAVFLVFILRIKTRKTARRKKQKKIRFLTKNKPALGFSGFYPLLGFSPELDFYPSDKNQKNHGHTANQKNSAAFCFYSSAWFFSGGEKPSRE